MNSLYLEVLEIQYYSWPLPQYTTVKCTTSLYPTNLLKYPACMTHVFVPFLLIAAGEVTGNKGERGGMTCNKGQI